MIIALLKKIHYKSKENKFWLFGVVLRKFFSRCMSDKAFIKWEFFSGMGKFPNLDSPSTFNEKLQWLKLNDIHPEYAKMVDKCEAKEYVRTVLGDKYIIPTLGIWNKWEEIDFTKLPEEFVLKTTHDSGGVVVFKNKEEKTLLRAKKKIKKSLKRNFYYEHREYPYKNIKPRILCEKYMVDESGTDLKDYKFFCFNGIVKFFKIDFERATHHRANYYDAQCNILPFGEKSYPPNPQKHIVFPSNIREMISIAEKLSKNIPFVRVDLYNVNENIFFGELTFFPTSGNGRYEPEEWDYKIGELLKLPLK